MLGYVRIKNESTPHTHTHTHLRSATATDGERLFPVEPSYKENKYSGHHRMSGTYKCTILITFINRHSSTMDLEDWTPLLLCQPRVAVTLYFVYNCKVKQ